MYGIRNKDYAIERSRVDWTDVECPPAHFPIQHRSTGALQKLRRQILKELARDEQFQVSSLAQ